jgi:hypothetical protein
MADFQPLTRMREFFFDRDVVMKAVDGARLKVLSQAGAFVRRTAQQSIRPGVRTIKGVSKRTQPSKPGKPPKSWTGLLKNFIFFAFDPTTKSVVVGPTPLNQHHVVGGQLTRGAVPQVLEKGGTIGIREYQLSGGLWVPYGRRARSRQGRPVRVRNVNIAARPYMGPSLLKNVSKFPSLWERSVRK